MAVQDSHENGASTPSEPQREETRREFEPQRQTEHSAQMNASITDITRLLGSPMGRRTTGESLVNAVKTAKFWFADERAGVGAIDMSKLQAIALDGMENNVSVSSVIITYPFEDQGVTKVLSHVLVLESTMTDETLVRNVDINHRTYPLPIVASDYVTEAYLALVDDTVRRTYAQSRRQVEVIPAGWRVVDRKVDFTDPEITEARAVIFYAVAALTSLYNDLKRNEVYFSLEWLNKQQALEINVDLSGRDSVSADGLPRRTDIAVSVAGTIRKADGTTALMPLSNIGGYMNLVYTPPQQEDRWARERRRDCPYFTPTFIINKMDTNGQAITPELLLLALGAASAVTKNQSWAQVFLPGDVARGDIDARDTGLLSILGPDGDGLPTEIENRGSLDIEKWGQYFFSLVDDNLALAIELEEGGDNSWITSLLLDAAVDDTANRAAVRRLYNYADRLTSNNFSRRAKELGVESPLEMSGARYLTGTWVDSHGNERDLREWDLLRWMATNPTDGGESALRYQDVVDRTDLDLEIRVSEQYEQLTGALQQNVKFTRYVDLAYINPKFIEALALAIADCKVSIDQRQAHYSFGARRLRGNTRIRDFRGGDLTHGLLNRRVVTDDRRNLRSHVSNGFGRSSF